MVHFRQKTPARNYLARGEQRRLLMLVMMLGLVIVLSGEAAKPQRWFWLWGGRPPAENADERLAAQASSTGEMAAPVVERQSANTSKRYFAGVRPEELQGIRDDTILRRSESDAFYHLLRILHQHSAQELSAASAGRVTLTQLSQQSNEYRGELVTVRGIVRAAVEKRLPPNEHGVDKYFELWLIPDDQRDTPLVIDCLELPAAFPQGARVAEEAAVTGFFFKRFAYQAADGRLHTTPLLLAKTVDWQPAPRVETTRLSIASFLWCAAAAAVIAAMVVMHARRRSAGPPPGDLPDRVDLSDLDLEHTAPRQADATNP